MYFEQNITRNLVESHINVKIFEKLKKLYT